MLYPIQTTSRELIDLSGIWDFKMGSLETRLAVPGSFNDQLAFTQYKNYMGDFEYSKDFIVTEAMMQKEFS